MKRLIAFDLDGTLAESKQAIDPEMGEGIAALTRALKVCVISGGDWPQFDAQIVARLPSSTALANLVFMPTSGAKLYHHAGDGWDRLYAEHFSDEERRTIAGHLRAAVAACGLEIEAPWGDQIEDRGSQITFSALGQQAPLSAKSGWDPDASKRGTLKNMLEPLLPDCAINIGGSSSIDVTRKGIDKGYAVRRLSEVTGLPLEDMLFVGDAIFPGGNDYAVKTAGVDCIRVRDVEETKRVIEAILAFCRPD